tara:strand:+ start:621 stop:806 length:186 start_codon:yes stop_codon:yes gene_type:complete
MTVADLTTEARIGLGLASLAFGMDRIVPADEQATERRNAKLEGLLKDMPSGNSWEDAPTEE